MTAHRGRNVFEREREREREEAERLDTHTCSACSDDITWNSWELASCSGWFPQWHADRGGLAGPGPRTQPSCSSPSTAPYKPWPDPPYVSATESLCLSIQLFTERSVQMQGFTNAVSAAFWGLGDMEESDIPCSADYITASIYYEFYSRMLNNRIHASSIELHSHVNSVIKLNLVILTRYSPPIIEISFCKDFELMV